MSNYESNDKEEGFESNSDEDNPVQMVVASIGKEKCKRVEDGMLVLSVGDEFDNVVEFRAKLRTYLIEQGFEINRIKNEKRRFKARCAGEADGIPCTWFIYAARVKSGIIFRIQQLNDTHTCDKNSKSKEASMYWIADHFQTSLKNDPTKRPSIMHKELRQKYGLHCNIKKIDRVTKIAKIRNSGSHSVSYQLLRNYEAILNQTNPGVLVKLQCIDGGKACKLRFLRFMFSFPALKHGFIKVCRWFISVDGCHLKGPYGGVLLLAVTLDANSGVFPIAVCICETESAETWRWFFSILR